MWATCFWWGFGSQRRQGQGMQSGRELGGGGRGGRSGEGLDDEKTSSTSEAH